MIEMGIVQAGIEGVLMGLGFFVLVFGAFALLGGKGGSC